MAVYVMDEKQTDYLPDCPAMVRDFLELVNKSGDQAELSLQLQQLCAQYPVFFERVLKIINSDHFNITQKVPSIEAAIELTGIEPVCQLLLLQAVYRTLIQYKVKGVKPMEFWQDSLRRAVSARRLGELIGLDPSLCFTAGFLQDIGLLLLFISQPDKGSLWAEFRKREPQARYLMEKNIFKRSHDYEAEKLFSHWGVFNELKSILSAHHQCEVAKLEVLELQLCKVLNCADWMSAVYTAEDKSHVINRCRTILAVDFYMEQYRAEELLEDIPDEVDLTALILEIDAGEHINFSQILYQANIRLNEDNAYFQDLAHRLDQALDERDQLAAEINRDLNLARKIQKSLLPDSRGDQFAINGINLSARILSGDFYDFFELQNGDIYFNLGDVSGKGVNAALLMAKTSSLFRCLGKRIEDPSQLLYEINNELCETSIHGMFVTLVAGVYRPETGVINIVNAGNPPPLFFNEDGICQEIPASAPPLGVVAGTEYPACEITLGSGSLYIYSDGVTEGYINDNSMLQINGLFKMIASMEPGLSPSQRLNTIAEKFKHPTNPLRDDVTLLLIEKPV